MARLPGAEFLGISDEPMRQHDIVCVHTIVGYQQGGNAAHFTTGFNGRIVQARDTSVRSDANLDGNWHVIAIENEDHGPDYSWINGQVPRFTTRQAASIVDILVWAYQTHGIPLELVPDSKVGRRGIAYHRQGIDGNFVGPYTGRVTGGERWSSKFGKVCPGDARIAQLVNEIIPEARRRAAPDNTEEDDNMVRFLKGDDPVWGKAVFKVEYSGNFPQIAVRTLVPNENEPGFRAFIASGGTVRVVPQSVLDAIPNKVVS